MRGIGVDIVEICRMQRAVERHGERFLRRIFTAAEVAYCTRPDGGFRYSSLAARFAAKEAFYKAAFPSLQRFIGWQECEVTSREGGAPALQLAPDLEKELGFPRVHLSLSHSQKYAVAVVLIE